MRWILMVVAVLVGLVVLAALIGMTRPKGHVAQTRAKYSQPPEQLWATLTDFEHWSEWNPTAKSVEPLPDQGGRRRMNVTGDWGTVPMEIAVWEPPHRLETWMDAGTFKGSWSYELKGTPDGGTELLVTEKGEVDNPLFRAMMMFMDMHSTMMSFHKGLAARTRDSVTAEKVEAVRQK
jgi:uncharacterized protein YndB with AHSA1/START domain